MLLHNDPFAVSLLHHAGPPGVFPRSGLTFVGIDVVENTVEPGNISAARKLDSQILQFMPDIFEIGTHPERYTLLHVFEAFYYPLAWRHADIVCVVTDDTIEQIEIPVLGPAID